MSELSPLDLTPKPPRTFGLSLAIFVSVLIYSLLPIIQVCMVVIPQIRFQTISLPFSADDEGISAFASGAEIVGISAETLVFQVALAIAFLVIAVLAWRGRPAAIRYVMMGAIVALLMINLGSALSVLLAQPDLLEQGLDSAEPLRRVLASTQAVTTILVSLYVIWYLNRGPARAFYRGYYIPDPRKTSPEQP